MKRVLFFGSPEWTWTRPVNRVFLDLRPETHKVYCNLDSGAGRIAARTAKASHFDVLTEWEDPLWNDMYWFGNSTDLSPIRDALAFGYRLHAFVSRRPERKVNE